MEYLRIVNWKRWQSWRSDRGQPPWIKLHRILIRNPEWISLSDSQRGQLVCLWMLAADYGGKIPDNEHYLESVLVLSKKLNLQPFIDLGFIEKRRQRDAKMTPQRRQADANVTPQSREEREREKKEKETNYARSPTADASAPGDAVFVTFPTNIKEVECPIFGSQVESWKATFPGVAVEQQIREARQWCVDNPTKRKTYGGMTRFIYNWLSRRQNAGGGGKRPVLSPDEHLKRIEGRSSK